MSRKTAVTSKGVRSSIESLRQYQFDTTAHLIEKYEILKSRIDWLEDRLARLWAPSSSVPPTPFSSETSPQTVDVSSAEKGLSRGGPLSETGGDGLTPVLPPEER